MVKKLTKAKSTLLLILVGLLIVPASWALFVPGFYGASDDIHIAWLFELHKVLMMGQIPPRFVPDLSFGFGYPLYNFVFPLPFYIAEIFHLLGFSLVDSIKTLFFISIPLSGLFMYFLLREYTNKYLSTTGAILYVYAPYRAVDLYIRGAIGEIVGFMFLPLIILSVVKVAKVNSWRWVGIGALTLASLVLSHNITAYMFTPFVGLFFLFQVIFNNKRWQFISKVSLMILLALLISLYFWLPAIVDSQLMKYDTVFNFADHFPTLSQLVTPYWGYGASVPGPYDGISFFLGLVNIGVLIFGLIYFFWFWNKASKDQRIFLSWSFVCLIWAVFLMNHRSTFLWVNLPLLPYFQFPWRFLILTTFAMPIFVIVFEKFPFNREISIVLIALTLMTAGSYFKPQDFLGRLDEYYINRYIPTPIASEEYKKTKEEYLRLPQVTKIKPDRNFPLLFPSDGITRIDKQNDLNISFQYEASSSSIINLNKYYFPGWQAKVDNLKYDVLTGQPYGQVSIEVPSGSHAVKLYFQETSFRSYLNFASLGAFLVSLGILLI